MHKPLETEKDLMKKQWTMEQDLSLDRTARMNLQLSTIYMYTSLVSGSVRICLLFLSLVLS